MALMTVRPSRSSRSKTLIVSARRRDSGSSKTIGVQANVIHFPGLEVKSYGSGYLT